MIFFRALCLGLFCWGLSMHVIPMVVLYRVLLGLGSLAFLGLWVYVWFLTMEKLNENR